MMGERLSILEIYEDTYRNHPDMQVRFVRLYEKMITFWSHALKFYRRKKCWLLVRAAWSNYDIEFESLEKSMKDEYKLVGEHSKALHESETRTRNKNKDVIHIKDWLSPVDTKYGIEYFEEDFILKLDKRHEGSCKWLLDTAQYCTWATSPTNSPESLFWINAAPGAGKTILASFLIDHLRGTATGSGSPVLFCMFDAQDADKCTSISAARTLTYQLLRNSNYRDLELYNALLDRCSQNRKSQTKDFGWLWELFCEHVKNSMTAIIIVDALEECKDMALFADNILKLSQVSQVKILVTSRRETHLLSTFATAIQLHFGTKENHEDISHYLATKIADDSNLSSPYVSQRLREHLGMNLAQYLAQRADGLFFWAFLVVEELQSWMTIEDTLQAVDDLPTGLSGMYDKILQNMPRHRRQLCDHILTWLTCAVRPLSVSEMWEILSREIAGGREEFLRSERDVECACGPLVRVVGGIMHLAHRSLVEYLCNVYDGEQGPSNSKAFSIDVSSANLRILNTSITYVDASLAHLKNDPIGNGNSYRSTRLKRDYIFLEYAVYNWLYHLMTLDVRSIPKKLHSEFSWSDRWLYWLEIWFSLETHNLWSLEQNIQKLLVWCRDLTPAEAEDPKLFTTISRWVEHVSQLLVTYGPTLEGAPSSVHAIDSEPARRSVDSSTDDLCEGDMKQRSSNRTRRITLRSKLGNKLYTANTNIRPPRVRSLEPLRYGAGIYALFRVDAERRTILMINYESRIPEIRTQDLQTGTRMMPTRRGRISSLHGRYWFEGSSLSKNSRYLATLYRTSVEAVNRKKGQCELVIWEISKPLDSAQSAGTPWGSVVFSKGFEVPFHKHCARPLVFDGDSTLYCLLSRIKIKPSVHGSLYLEEEILQGAELQALEGIRGFGYSSDCQYLTVLHGQNQRLVRLRTEDLSVDGITTLESSNALVHCVSHSGRFVVWQDTLAEGSLHLQDWSRNMCTPLPRSEQIAPLANLNLAFSQNDDCLLGVMTRSISFIARSSYIAIWKSLSETVCLTFSDPLPPIVGFHFTSLEDRAYIATTDRWIDFNPSHLDFSQAQVQLPTPPRSLLRPWISHDGNWLALLYLTQERLAIIESSIERSSFILIFLPKIG